MFNNLVYKYTHCECWY